VNAINHREHVLSMAMEYTDDRQRDLLAADRHDERNAWLWLKGQLAAMRATERNKFRVCLRQQIWELLTKRGSPMNTASVTEALNINPTQTSSMLNMMSKPDSKWPVVRVAAGRPGPGGQSSVWAAMPRKG
jgi:hypothetical protein